MSAQSILSVLNPDVYEVTQIGITPQGQWVTGKNVLETLKSSSTKGLKPAIFLPEPGNSTLYTLKDGQLTQMTDLDVIFPVLHGTFGEDGTIQGLLEMADIAYVGAGVLGSSVGMDKGLFKYVMLANHIPVLDFIILNRGEIQENMGQALVRAESVADYPLFVKPANLGSSVGISKCRNRSDLIEGLLEAAAYDRRIIVERGIEAREIEISVLGNENPSASIPGEIIPKDEFYTYAEKYIHDTAELVIPAPLAEEQSKMLQSIALKAYKAIDCAGMARVDFFIDKKTDNFYLGELNTIPGFTNISMYPKLWEVSGLPYSELVDKLIEFALMRKSQRDQTEREFKH